MAIQLSSKFDLSLDKCDADTENRLKQILPALIAATVRAGTMLNVFDKDSESLSGIVADEIVKAGVLIHHLEISKSLTLCRTMALVKQLKFAMTSCSLATVEILKVIESYTEFPHLKVLHCFQTDIAPAILAKSQVQVFSANCVINESALSESLATQTQLQKVDEVGMVSDAGAFIASLPKSVQSLSLATGRLDPELLVELIFICQMQYVKISTMSRFADLNEFLQDHLDPNQQSKGIRTREFDNLKFQVSANNLILNPSFTFEYPDSDENESPYSDNYSFGENSDDY